MPKIRTKADGNGPEQMSLFDMAQAVAEQVQASRQPTTEGSCNIKTRLRVALKSALKASPLSRAQVVGEMGHLLGDGVEVSQYMLDTWTAESKDGHRIPAEYLPAFCIATGSREPLVALAEASGWFALPGPDALRSQMQRLDEEAKRLAAKRRELSVLLKTAGGK